MPEIVLLTEDDVAALTADYDAYVQVVNAARKVPAWMREKAGSISLWRAACDADDPRAMVLLGEVYSEGFGQKPDHEEAFRLFQKAALTRLPQALYLVGECLTDGAGCPRDRKK